MPLAPTNHQLSLSGATWVDINTLFTVNALPDRVPDEQAIIYSSLFNLLNCPIGGRSRTFQPTYGSILYRILQEPVDDITTRSIQIGFIQAIAKWEPRITLDFSNTYVNPDYNLPGYRVRLAFVINLSQQRVVQDFSLVANS